MKNNLTITVMLTTCVALAACGGADGLPPSAKPTLLEQVMSDPTVSAWKCEDIAEPGRPGTRIKCESLKRFEGTYPPYATGNSTPSTSPGLPSAANNWSDAGTYWTAGGAYCFVGARGGTYKINANGNKDYGGC